MRPVGILTQLERRCKKGTRFCGKKVELCQEAGEADPLFSVRKQGCGAGFRIELERKGERSVEERVIAAEGQGKLVLMEEGGRVQVRVRRPDDGRGLYKAYLLGAGGRFLLGTLAPENGALTLCRTLSLRELERQGVWPPSGGCVDLAFPFQKSGEALPGWRREECPERLMGDPLLRRCARELRGVLLRRTGEGFQLALPWREDAPFPFTPLFCFAVPREAGGKRWAVYTFSGRGCPQMHKTDGEGDTTGVNF